jgi:diguanylate cyclase (GGDEF)-like protein
MRHVLITRFAVVCAILGMLLTSAGVGLVVSRQNTERAALDRGLSTTAVEKSALIDTELERVRALALLTARIPPFAELFADKGSQAAAIAAVAGPEREVNEALAYLWTLYPERIVAAGYVDVHGVELSRIVRGVATRPDALSPDVRDWPEFAQGLNTPPGRASISAPFISRRTGVPVVAATTRVFVDGRPRAFVELELATSALHDVLSLGADGTIGLEVTTSDGTEISSNGHRYPRPPGRPRTALLSADGWRYAVRPVPTGFADGRHWYVVATGRSRSALALVVAPTQSGIVLLALALFIVAGLGLRRAGVVAGDELVAEQLGRAEAERRSLTDTLTGLFNRRHAVEQLAHELTRSERNGSGVGLLMFDIDRFKRINDSQGHAGGDAVIVEVARRLQTGVRDWDTVARIGGEEFFVIVPDLTSEDAVAELGERLREAVAGSLVVMPRGAELTVTVSVGAVLVRNGEGSAEFGMDRADRALYAAKRQGRNRLCRFSQLRKADLTNEHTQAILIAEALALTSGLGCGAPEGRSRVAAELAATIARSLGLSEDQVLLSTLAGWLGDLGRLAIPDLVSPHAGTVSDAELGVMRAHLVVVEELLDNFPEVASAGSILRHLHERYDGTGHPDRLAGAAIPVEARIVAVADAYAALVCGSSNAPGWTSTAAVDELTGSAGGRFDPRVVAALATVQARPRPSAMTVPAGPVRSW